MRKVQVTCLLMLLVIFSIIPVANCCQADQNCMLSVWKLYVLSFVIKLFIFHRQKQNSWEKYFFLKMGWLFVDPGGTFVFLFVLPRLWIGTKEGWGFRSLEVADLDEYWAGVARGGPPKLWVYWTEDFVFLSLGNGSKLAKWKWLY